MHWHTEMACGVHLGILLICLVQAEHICCLWATQALSSQRQNSNTYVGFSQQHSGQGRLGGSYPQNQLRQASAQSSSFNTDTALSSGSSQGLSNSGYTQTFSQPAQSGYSSVRLVKINLLSKPNWQVTKSNQVNAQKVPKKDFGLSTSIASGTSVSKYSQKQNDLPDISKKRAWPIQQGTQSTSKYLSSSSAFVQSPSSKSSSASHQWAAQSAPSAAETPAYYGQRGSSPKSSSLFGAGAPGPQRNAVQMQTSASAPARRVSSRRSTKASKPSYLSSQNERTQSDPSQTEAGKRFKSKLFQVDAENGRGSSKPTSMSSMASSYVRNDQHLPVSNKQNAGVDLQPRSRDRPINQRLSYKPSYTSTELVPSSMSSLTASWNRRNQGGRDLSASRGGRAGTSAQRFAPTRTHSIPERFGGFAIRRLREPAHPREAGVRRPQQTHTAPSRQSVYEPQVQGVHRERNGRSVRPPGTQEVQQVSSDD